MKEHLPKNPRPGIIALDSEWRSIYESKNKSIKRALGVIRNGHRIFIGSGCAEPQHLAQGLEEALPGLSDIEILHILSVGKTRYTEAGFDQCRLKSFFVAAASREAVAKGRADYTPINLADVPGLFRSGAMPIDVALIQVSPPDEHGFCSFGIAVDIVKPAAENAGHVIAQVNRRMPRTLGDSFIHVSQIDAFVEHDEPLLEVGLPLMNPVAVDIGRHVAELIEDGSTIRVGVGSISTAALYALENKNDLGVHTDMLTDAYMHLAKMGVITNRLKTLHPGKIVTSFCLGTKELYDFVDNNPMVAFYPVDYTNNYLVISQNEMMVSINSGLEVDLTGQVCSDSTGYEIYSGVGGAIDFLRGARCSRRGKAIMVLPSTTLTDEKSRIVPALTEGAGVVMTRGGVQYVVTEYGAVNLHGRCLRERALALISIAHPNFRDELMEAARDLRYVERGKRRMAKAAYPYDWEEAEDFKDIGRILFRPVKAADEQRLTEFLHLLAREDAVSQFLPGMKDFPVENVKAMVDIDYRSEMCVLGLCGDPGAERAVAIARYTLDEENMSAEADLALHPGYTRKGTVISFMLRQLAEKCRSKDIKTLVFYLSVGSERIFGAFQDLEYQVEITMAGDCYEVSVHLDQPAQTSPH